MPVKGLLALNAFPAGSIDRVALYRPGAAIFFAYAYHMTILDGRNNAGELHCRARADRSAQATQGACVLIARHDFSDRP